MNNTNRLLSFLRSDRFAIIIAILSVVVQSFHSFTAFYNTSSLKDSAWGIAQAVLFAVIIDMAILFYTVRGRTDIAKIAALAMVIINGYYYFQHLGISFEFIFGVFLSLIIPVSVYFYSEELGKERDDEKGKRIDDLVKRIEALVKLNKFQADKINEIQDREDNLVIEYDKVKEQNSNLANQYEGRIYSFAKEINEMKSKTPVDLGIVSSEDWDGYLQYKESLVYPITDEEIKKTALPEPPDQEISREGQKTPVTVSGSERHTPPLTDRPR